MADYLWLSQFTRKTWDPYGFGFACAYSNGKPTPIDANPAGLAHSTETPAGSVPSYGGGKSNPNFTVDPWTKRRYQHVPANIAARAMVSNNSAVVQVEIIGYCDKATAQKYGVMGSYLPNLDADGRAYLAESLKIIGDALGIPATTSVKWLPYPASYGNNGIRLTNSTIRTVKGWIGHQHAPAPDDHGDPGDWFPAVLALMAAKTGGTGGTTTGTGGKADTSFPVLTKGSTGDSVRKLQAWLLAMFPTYAKPAGTNGKPDGSFGAGMERVVKEWQRRSGLTPDGAFGPKSLATARRQGFKP